MGKTNEEIVEVIAKNLSEHWEDDFPSAKVPTRNEDYRAAARAALAVAEPLIISRYMLRFIKDGGGEKTEGDVEATARELANLAQIERVADVAPAMALSLRATRRDAVIECSNLVRTHETLPLHYSAIADAILSLLTPSETETPDAK